MNASLPVVVGACRRYVHSNQIKITNVSGWTFFKNRLSLVQSPLPGKIYTPIPKTIGQCGYFTYKTGSTVKLLGNLEVLRAFPKREIHPAIWVIARPLFKLVALITGREIRKWWKDLPPNKKKYFWDRLRENRFKIGGGVSVLGILVLFYYLSHIQTTPITKRERFIAFNAEQFKQVGDSEFKKVTQEFEHLFLPSNHPYTKRVQTVVNRLLSANTDIKEVHGKDWAIAVVNDDTENAFVLPNGQIFVFGGMLKLCTNNDELGSILAHEMSHCILGHGGENFSQVHLLDCAMILVIAAIWAILPSDILAIVTHWLANQLVALTLQLPYNRKLETEADEVGLKLAAKACFDVRVSSAFWSKMRILEKERLKKNFQDLPDIEFISTHPSHKKRSQHLDALMNDALQLRVDCGCYKLRTPDPRLHVEMIGKMLDEERQKYRIRKVVLHVPS